MEKNGAFVAATGPFETLRIITSTGILREIYHHDFNYSQITADQLTNLAYVISTPMWDKKTEVRAIDITKRDLVVSGPVKIAAAKGIQKTIHREHPSVAADPKGGLWVAYNDSTADNWKVYIRHIKLSTGKN